MEIGTRSILFGAHQFIIHPLLVARAWWILYGFPFDPRLWIAFFIHDLGYWGKPNMDGVEGKKHPEGPARIMDRLFGKEWGDLCRYHSKDYARSKGAKYSKLCIADKLVMSLEWRWLYLLRVILTDEIKEYMSEWSGSGTSRQWFDWVSQHLKGWVVQAANHDGIMINRCNCLSLLAEGVTDVKVNQVMLSRRIDSIMERNFPGIKHEVIIEMCYARVKISSLDTAEEVADKIERGLPRGARITEVR